MGMFALAATVASTALQVAGNQQAANQQKAWLDYNAAQTEADAEANMANSKIKAEKIRKMGESARGEAAVALAGSGVDVNSGTALAIDENIVQNVEEDAWMTVYNGVLESNRMKTQAQSDRIAGQQTMTANNINQAATVLGGASQAYSGWKNMSKSKSGITSYSGG